MSTLLCFMSRAHRPHLPGGAFHITSRTQGHQPWFTESIRDRIEEIIVNGFATSDAQLIAATIMPNHFHLVVRQGMHVLGWTMQPILRRVALIVQRSTGVKGHVFERPFRAKHCDTASYLRNSIIYTNVNPQRAGICDSLGRYRCSSHGRFLTGNDRPGCKAVGDVLPLFCDRHASTTEELCDNYRRYAIWRLAKDEADKAGVLFGVPEPRTRFGDSYFADNFVAWTLRPRCPLRDLRDKARDLMCDIDPSFDLTELKGKVLSRPRSRVRRQLIAALLQAGYSCKSVADFLRISDSTVSEVASQLRYCVLGLSRNPEGGPQ